MNLTRYNDNLRLNGYYPQVDHEGELIEYSLAYLERQDRREQFYCYILFLTFATTLIFLTMWIERRDNFLLAKYVIDYQERKEKKEKAEKKELYNFRKYVGIDK